MTLPREVWGSFLESGGVFRSPKQFGVQGRAVYVSTATPQMRLSALQAGSSEVGSDQITLTGCALPFDKLGSPDASGIREIYKRGAFANSLLANKDITVMFNFRTDRVLGRTKAGTALVYESADGLRFEVQPPTNNYGSDLVVSISRGDITGAAVAGVPTHSHVEYRGGDRVRVIDAAQIISVSICSFAQFDSGIGVNKQHASPIAALTPRDHELLGSMGIKGARF